MRRDGAVSWWAWGGLAVVAVVALVAGWKTFEFVCDDAYIDFRYVSARQLGWGYTWNPPPFRPVEGYTSFLWVVALDAVWTLFGVPPTASATVMSLGLSLVSLGLVTAIAHRMPLGDRLARHRFVLVALVLAATLTNRTFLAWTSSGLETALWTAVLLAWVAVTVLPGSPHLLAVCSVAAVAALVRPDGLGLCACAVAIVLWTERSPRRALLALSPLLVPAVHLLWRRATYDAWVPNTYVAKVGEPWPLGGAVYAASFLLEYALYVWVVVLLAAGVRVATRWWRDGPSLRVDPARRPAVVGIAAIVAHAAYYTFVVGGDHFEYRIYHHLVPLFAASFPWLVDRLGGSIRHVITVMALTTVIGWAIPWSHWSHTHTITVMKTQGMPHFRIAPHWPGPVRWYAEAWDELQGFLIRRFVGLRHQSHVNFVAGQIATYPTREEGLAMDPSGFPVHTAAAVGGAGWTLPHVAVIDKLGLNDAVAARSPTKHSGQWNRKMAHERYAPPGYLECFDPNVRVAAGNVIVRPRAEPLTAERIEACESEWLARVSADRSPAGAAHPRRAAPRGSRRRTCRRRPGTSARARPCGRAGGRGCAR
jgi:arabinofuranosyltransferase